MDDAAWVELSRATRGRPVRRCGCLECAYLTAVTLTSLFRPSVRYGKRETVARTSLILPPKSPSDNDLVSEVRGQLRGGLTAIDLLKAAFPGGSVTGAPKVRAMEIIAELEPTARGSYCGALGYVGFDGTMDTNILIRTFTAARGWVQFPVGGGIVADSDPRREYEETLHKAEGLVRALR